MDSYKTLELDENASLAEIIKSYREHAKKYHPDRNKSPEASEKFREIVDAYEDLCHRKGQRYEDFVDSSIIPGRISIGTPGKHSSGYIIQGHAYAHGMYRTSEDNHFSILFKDGIGNSDRWINGRLYFMEKDNLLWIKEFERPMNGAVSNNGKVVLIHTINRNSYSSTHKEFVDLGETLSVIDKSGEEVFTYEFGSNTGDCIISNNGNLVLATTLMPDNSVYYFDLEYLHSKGLNGSYKEISFKEVDRTGYWKYKNHARNLISHLRFRENLIEIFTEKSTKSVNRAYALQTDGTLLSEYAKEVQDLTTIKKQKPDMKVESLIMMINSGQRKKLVEGLWLFVRFVKTKGSWPYYLKIAKSLEKHIKTDDLEVFDVLWKVIKEIIKRRPQAIEPYISHIVARLKRSGNEDELYLSRLGELGRANPKWIVNEMPLIRRKLYSQKWNERRFAAFAIAAIGSTDASIVEETIPVLVEYAANPDKVRKEMGGRLVGDQVEYTISEGDTEIFSLKASEICSIEMDRATMIRDACIDALGEIGRNSPKSVQFAIPLLEEVSRSAPSLYSVKKALRAIDSINGKYQGSFRHS